MDEPELNKDRHIQYFQRCLKSILPTGYTSNDSSRIALVFFILSALDLLGAGPDTFARDERDGVKRWLLSCQCRRGGFAGNPGLRFDDAPGDAAPWLDGASVPMTYFALMGLALVDGLDEVERAPCLTWLQALQRGGVGRARGGFAEARGLRDGDMRVGYAAAAIRWILGGGDEGWSGGAEGDIDVESFVSYFRAGETYDGGISESALHESHGGYVACAITALALLDRLPVPPTFTTTASGKPPGLTNVGPTIRWLMERQQAYIAIDQDFDEVEPEDERHDPTEEFKHDAHPSLHPSNLFGTPKESSGKQSATVISPLIPQTFGECYYVGQNGRCNKPVDTCYSYWNCASLDALGQGRLIQRDSIRRFLLGQTQHRIGGFGKSPGDAPDIYHSYLALAALATMKEAGLKEIDAALCVSLDVKRRIAAFKERRGQRAADPLERSKVFDLLDGMVRANVGLKGLKADGRLAEMEKEKEQLVAAARLLRV